MNVLITFDDGQMVAGNVGKVSLTRLQSQVGKESIVLVERAFLIDGEDITETGRTLAVYLKTAIEAQYVPVRA